MRRMAKGKFYHLRVIPIGITLTYSSKMSRKVEVKLVLAFVAGSGPTS